MNEYSCALDTGVLIQLFRGRRGVRAALAPYVGAVIPVVPTIVRFELLQAMRPGEEQKTHALLAEFPSCPVDENVADEAARLARQLTPTNRNPGVRDLLIATTALFHQIPVLTMNPRHFEPISDLEVIDFAIRLNEMDEL